jgi:Zn-dependent peptidase ImmA (M78 family)
MSKIAEIVGQSKVPTGKLSHRSGLSIERLEEIKKGAEPSLAELRRLASALSIPLTYFLAPPRSREKVDLLFRQNFSGSRVPNHSTMDFLAARMGYSLDLLESYPNGRGMLQEIDVKGETYESAEQASRHFRELFFEANQVGPLLELPRLLTEKLKIIVFVGNLREFDGASAVIEGQSFIFVSSRYAPRMLFTLAHELGHLIAHSKIDERFAVLDRGTGEARIGKSHNPKEAFADTFASCLLLPIAGVGAALRTIREVLGVTADEIGDVELLYLSRIFGVSFQVAARRCEELDLLPSGGARSLYEKLCAEYGSPEKRAESLSLPERPNIEFSAVPPMLIEATLEKIRAGEISIGRASELLGVSLSDVIAANAPTSH